jgi:hypothetical protein
VETRPLAAEPCLLVPLRPVAAWTPDLIERYRPLLALYALSDAFRRALEAEGEAAEAAVAAHLARHRRHYSQLIWLHMEPSAREWLLAGYSYAGRLLQQVDPAPVAALAGALAFRLLAPPDPAAWEQQQAAAGMQSPSAARSDAIALPGGVAAEALLGDPSLSERRVTAVLPVALDAPLGEVDAVGRIVVEVG